MNDMGIGSGYKGEDRDSETSGLWIWLSNQYSVSGVVNRKVQCHGTVSWCGSKECMRKCV